MTNTIKFIQLVVMEKAVLLERMSRVDERQGEIIWLMLM